MLYIEASEVFKSEESLKSNGKNNSDKRVAGGGGGSASHHHRAGRTDHDGRLLVFVGLRLRQIGGLIELLLKRYLLKEKLH